MPASNGMSRSIFHQEALSGNSSATEREFAAAFGTVDPRINAKKARPEIHAPPSPHPAQTEDLGGCPGRTWSYSNHHPMEERHRVERYLELRM